MRRSIAVMVAVLVIAVVFVGGPSLLFSPSTTDIAPEEADRPDPDLVTFEDSSGGIWAYLSPEQEFHERSPINVIVRGDTQATLQALSEEGEGEWEEMDEEEFDAEPETFAFVDDQQHHATGIEWGEADGTTRYAWIDADVNPGTDGAATTENAQWATETVQLDDGDYYGYRYHIRLYESPDPGDEWVAMQAHSEHFDWFTLRHRVDGVESAQSKVESDLMDLPHVDPQEDVSRIYLENDGPADSDGWATLVDLRSLVLFPVLIGVRNRRTAAGDRKSDSIGGRVDAQFDEHLTDVDRQRLEAAADRIEAGHIVLVFTILALFLGVRIVGIALERHVVALSPHAIAALLYPVIAVGIPLATYLIARQLTSRLDAALVASGALTLAIWLDYGLLGVDTLPIDVVVQRMLVVVALGLIAGGAAKRATRKSAFNDMLIGGVLLWTIVLVGTVFGYL